MTSLSWEDSNFAVYRLENIFQWIHNYNTIRSILSSDFKWISYCISKVKHQIQEVSFKYIMSTSLGPKRPYCCSNMWHMLQITITVKCACRQMCALELSLKFEWFMIVCFSLSMFMALISPIGSDVPIMVHGRVRESKCDSVSTRVMWCSG